MECFDISNSNLTTLVGITFPDNLRFLDCSNNNLTDLKGCPETLEILYCWQNQLTSLKDCPKSIKSIMAGHNQLTTLIGCPNELMILECSDNLLTTLKGCPNSVTVLSCYSNPLDSDWKLPKEEKYNILIGNYVQIKLYNDYAQQIPGVDQISSRPTDEQWDALYARYYRSCFNSVENEYKNKE